MNELIIQILSMLCNLVAMGILMLSAQREHKMFLGIFPSLQQLSKRRQLRYLGFALLVAGFCLVVLQTELGYTLVFWFGSLMFSAVAVYVVTLIYQQMTGW